LSKPEETCRFDHAADDVVDYRGHVTAAVREGHPNGVDAVLHFAGDGAELAALLSPGAAWHPPSA